MTDILIIGGGPAGLTAALYAARAGKSVTVCEGESLGGQITQSPQVDNYPGLPQISGMELGDRLCAQAMDAGAQIEFTTVNTLTLQEDGSFTAQTDDGVIEAKAVIFAAGAKPRPMGVADEADWIGKGVGYCALCDGAFFKGKDVAVVGGGSTAFSDALYLSKICNSVTLIHRREAFRAEQALVDTAKAAENIRILTPYTVISLRGTEVLEAITAKHAATDATMDLKLQGVFVAVGHAPDCSLIAPYAQLDEGGYAASGEDCRTRTPSLFVAGDCRAKAIRQLTTAMADGTAAAVAACEYLEQK